MWLRLIDMMAKGLWPMTAVVAGTIGLAQFCFLLGATAVRSRDVAALWVLLAGVYLKLQDALAASMAAARPEAGDSVG